jgi:hypothetical protein
VLGTNVSIPTSPVVAQLALRDSDTRSVKRISEREATRSREGFARDVLEELDVEAPEDA